MNFNTLLPNYNNMVHGLNVLLVDSDRDSLRYMKLVLEEQLHQVIDVPSTMTGLAKVYDLRNQFDIAIVDMQMPDTDILQDLKKALVNMFVPMILISDDENMGEKAKDEGAIAFFKKPIEYDNLINIWEFAPKKTLKVNQSISGSSSEAKGVVNLAHQIPVPYHHHHHHHHHHPAPNLPVNNNQGMYHYTNTNIITGKMLETSLFGGSRDTRKLSYEERAKIRIERMKNLSKPYPSNTNTNTIITQQKHLHHHNSTNTTLSSSPQGINLPHMQDMVGSLISYPTQGSTPLQADVMNEAGAFCLDRAGNIMKFEDNKKNIRGGKSPIAPPLWIAAAPHGEGEYNNMVSEGGQSRDEEQDWVAQWLSSIPKTDDEFHKFLDDLDF